MAEDAGPLTLQTALPTSGDVGKVVEEEAEGAELAPPLFGGGGGTSSSSISAAIFCSVALRSATRSAMRASRSLSSSSCRDSGTKNETLNPRHHSIFDYLFHISRKMNHSLNSERKFTRANMLNTCYYNMFPQS